MQFSQWNPLDLCISQYRGLILFIQGLTCLPCLSGCLNIFIVLLLVYDTSSPLSPLQFTLLLTSMQSFMNQGNFRKINKRINYIKISSYNYSLLTTADFYDTSVNIIASLFCQRSLHVPTYGSYVPINYCSCLQFFLHNFALTCMGMSNDQ